MDTATRRIVVVIASIIGLTFLIIGVLAAIRGESVSSSGISIAAGLVWLTGAYLLARRMRRV